MLERVFASASISTFHKILTSSSPGIILRWGPSRAVDQLKLASTQNLY